jgi:D-glycerate 3-kinase
MSTSAQKTWSPLARSLAAEYCTNAVRCVAISGAQGSGKTTLARILTQELMNRGLRAIACSLDDFYLPRVERLELSRTVHPLLRTRGVPGTHDVDLCMRVLDRVARGPTPMPRFDKATDDRVEPSRWPVEGPADVVVIEGWCLGARAQPAADLVEPINDLERNEDRDARFRGFVNTALLRYQALFERFDKLIYLQVPNFEAVLRWRAEQETQIEPARRMTEAELTRFVAHYERLTRWMCIDLPPRADLTVVLDEAHGIATSRT